MDCFIHKFATASLEEVKVPHIVLWVSLVFSGIFLQVNIFLTQVDIIQKLQTEAGEARKCLN